MFRKSVASAAMMAAIALSLMLVSASHSQIVLRTPSMLSPERFDSKQNSLTQRMGLSKLPGVDFVAFNRDQAEALKQRLRAKAQATEKSAKFRANLRRSMATGTTYLEAYNPGSGTVLAWLTVPTTSSIGGPTQASQLAAYDAKTGNSITIVIPYTQSPANPQIGYLNLSGGQTAVITATNSGNSTNTMDGVTVTFTSPPQCPCNSGCLGPTQFVPGLTVPNGTNFGEVTLNPPGGDQEASDISCVNGANSSITITFSGGPAWNDGPNTVTSVSNSWVDVSTQQDNNCGLPGVFPYGLSACTSGSSTCNPSNSFCTNSQAICALQRNQGATGAFGGTVCVTFNGPLSPP
jgi:hypothetical protein